MSALIPKVETYTDPL